MKLKSVKSGIISFIFVCSSAQSEVIGATLTETGIPLDQPWKIQLYQFAQKNVVHPSWGITHSERDFQVTVALAKTQNSPIDIDILFAAAFLHDLGGIGSFQKEGVDHAVRSVELAGPLLQSFGFPMSKFDAVKEMILGHTYYGPVPQSPQAQFFREADVLDFLGIIGITRILAITQEPGQSGKLSSTVGLLNKFIIELPTKLLSPYSKSLAIKRVKEMQDFMSVLKVETFGGKAL